MIHLEAVQVVGLEAGHKIHLEIVQVVELVAA